MHIITTDGTKFLPTATLSLAVFIMLVFCTWKWENRSMKRALSICVAIVSLVATLPAYGGDPRFSRELEYDLMGYCIDETQHPEDKAKLCDCALKKTQEDGPGGFLSEYDSDEVFEENKSKFAAQFTDNMKHYTIPENKKECLQ